MRIVVNDQVHLSELLPSDRAACVEYLNDRQIYDQTLRIPYPYTDADFDRWLGTVAERQAKHGRPVHWAIRREDGSLIGGCGFDSLAIGESHRAEVGYWLARPYWGRGIMTAVVRCVCAHAFSEFRLVKIVAHVFAFNVASARVVEKCGFEQEGLLRKHFQKDGRYIDAKLYALLKDE